MRIGTRVIERMEAAAIANVLVNARG